MKDIKTDILYNALDFLDESLKKFADRNADERDLKFATLSAISSVELLLKSYIYTEHWSLIFLDIGKAKKENLQSGDFQSIGMEESIKRLKTICNITISPQDERTLRALKRTRNRMQHFIESHNSKQTEALIVKTWTFIQHFIELPKMKTYIDGEKQCSDLLEEIRMKMFSHEKFIKEKLTQIQPEIDRIQELGFILDCPFCLQATVSLENGLYDTRCLFCLESIKEDVVKDIWLTSQNDYWDPREDSRDPYSECPACRLDSLYCQIDDRQFICLNCLEEFPAEGFTECCDCQNMFPNELAIGTRCPSCFGHYMDKD